jgi:uncharacterized membrane protein YkoI
MMRLRALLPLPLLLAISVRGADESASVALAQTPPAVQATIAAQIGSGTLGEIDRSVEEGQPVFDVSFTSKSGDEGGFSVAADGALTSTEVTLAETPAAVHRTIQAQAGGWVLDGIDKETDDTGTTYDIEVTKDGRTQSFTVDDDGTLLSVAVELQETPAAVQKAIQAQAAGGEIDSIDRNLDDDTEITYDVEAVGNGRTRSFTVADDGALISQEVALAQTPAPAQATINAQIAGGILKSIDENMDPDGVTFDVDAVLKNGAKKSFTVGPGGALRSEEVPFNQIPPAARQTIQLEIGAGKIIRIDKSFGGRMDKFLPYEVEGRKGGKPFNFSVGPKGRFLGMDE